MKNTTNYDVRSFVDFSEKIQKKVESEKAITLQNKFIGDKVDEFQVHARITSYTEMIDFIKFLELSTPCLYKK